MESGDPLKEVSLMVVSAVARKWHLASHSSAAEGPQPASPWGTLWGSDPLFSFLYCLISTFLQPPGPIL